MAAAGGSSTQRFAALLLNSVALSFSLCNAIMFDPLALADTLSANVTLTERVSASIVWARVANKDDEYFVKVAGPKATPVAIFYVDDVSGLPYDVGSNCQLINYLFFRAGRVLCSST